MARIDNEDMKVDWQWTEFKTVVIQRLINNWIKEYEIFSAESLFQCDNGLIESPNLVAQIIEVLDIDVEYKDNE